MRLPILHTNDFHGRLVPELAERIRARREELGALYFDSGDCIKAGNLAIPVRPEKAWGLLQEAGCAASVLGNRETHPLASAFLAKLQGAGHPVLAANLRAKSGEPPTQRSLLLEHKGVRVGVFGVMVAMVTERMATQAASAYLWDPPIATALTMAEQLRPQCDVLIALTHVGHRQDVALAEKGAPIDIILGGHSHTVLEHPERVGRTWVAQGGSHARFLGEYVWDGETLAGGLVALS